MIYLPSTYLPINDQPTFISHLFLIYHLSIFYHLSISAINFYPLSVYRSLICISIIYFYLLSTYHLSTYLY